MKRLGALCLTILFTAIIATGCGHRDSGVPMLPGDQPRIQNTAVTVRKDNRHIWGLWEVNISEDRQVAEIIPARIGEMHLNVVRLLEVTPCKNCLTISNIKIVEPNVLEADLTLTHPYPGLIKFSAFDVRGIFISQADYTFPASGRKIVLGDGVPRMLDPDGYTPLFNPTEYPAAIPPALGYIAGKYSTGGDLSATLNPFTAYRKDAPRRLFEAGGSETKTVRIHAPAGPFHFGYAIDVCWQLVENVVDPLIDFPPDANCLEAYRISVEVGGEIAAEVGGEAPIEVKVYDHQGQDTIESVNLEAPDLFEGEIPLSFSTVMPDEACLFTGIIPNYLGAPEGDYLLLVRVIDKEADQNLGAVDAWQLSHALVGPAHGWARTWGGAESDIGFGVAVDPWGHIYVVGAFRDTVDFDPGQGEDYHSSNGVVDSFLSKFDPAGQFEWARTWGGGGVNAGNWPRAVAVDGSGGVYVAGEFNATADFDPGPEEDIHSPKTGQDDAFLSKFDSDGNFIWARTWGGSEIDDARGLAVHNSGYALVCGKFSGTVDFDPGPGIDEHTSDGAYDVYLSKFDTNGSLIWARTWGGDDAYGVAVDGVGNAYVTGYSSGAFLSKFSPDGDLVWTCKLTEPDYASQSFDVAVNDLGNLYVTGKFWGTADFDPGPGEDIHSSASYYAIFLSKFDVNGNFLWARTWGGVELFYDDAGSGVAVDKAGNAFAAGGFSGVVDFDPGDGTDNHSADGYADAFLSKFDANGNFAWARTWGGTDLDAASGVAVSSSGTSYVTGWYWSDSVDFDPSAGVDTHYTNGPSDTFLSKFLPDGSW
jgi:hypothetical protein